MPLDSTIPKDKNDVKRKKIIIVNNNMNIGGVQKALLDLLTEISSHYDITLCLFNKSGVYLERIPQNVNVISCNSFYKYLGMSQAESKRKNKDYFLRSFFAILAKFFGRHFTTSLISAFSKKIPTEFDCAISYLHEGGTHSLYGGCNHFVLSKVTAKKKITFLHCDYEKVGAFNKKNNKIYTHFDRIAACSDGVKAAFLRVLPEFETKIVTIPNCHNFDEIMTLSQRDTVIYDSHYTNIAIVARLNPEKGVDRAIHAAKYLVDRNLNVRFHIVGNGILKDELNDLCKKTNIAENVFFYGEQENPYRFLKNADFLFIPSHHEAAPLVIDEALCLGVPVMSTRTTSSTDMILNRHCGWVCENTQESINRALYEIIANENEIPRIRKEILDNLVLSNANALNMFETIINQTVSVIVSRG